MRGRSISRLPLSGVVRAEAGGVRGWHKTLELAYLAADHDSLLSLLPLRWVCLPTLGTNHGGGSPKMNAGRR